MSKDGESGCPDANVLAAYLDGQLDRTTSAALEAHLASCEECGELLTEVLSVREAVAPQVPVPDDAADTTGRWTRRVVSGGAVAAAIVAALVLPEVAGRSRDHKLADLAVAAGARWPVEGRLTGGIPHSSLNAPLAGGQGGAVGDPVRVQFVAGKIREDLDARGTPERFHSFGLSQLLLGRLDAASVALTAAAREQPHNAAYQSDAAALYLERARAGLHLDDLPRALAAAERARIADPSLLEGAFNRALALERMSLRTQARQAWLEYLGRDSASDWAGEARRHLASLQTPPAASSWSSLEVGLRRNVDATTAEEAVRSAMSAARTFLETELWPAWAAAVEQGDGSRQLEGLRIFAAAFAQVSGDQLYADAVAAIDRAAGTGASALRRLGAAHRQYAAAAALYADDRFADAMPGLSAARAALAAAGSPFVSRADIDLAGAAFYTGQSTVATGVLSGLAKAADRGQYAYLIGRTSWLQGLMAFAQGRYGESRALWEATLATFEQSADLEQAAGAHGLLANLHDVLGDSQQAWAHRTLAMEDPVVWRNARLAHGLLTGAAGQALKEGSAEAALLLQDEVVANALAMDRPAAVVDAFAQRAAILLDLGRSEDAKRDIATARAEATVVPPGMLRDRRESVLLELEARGLLAVDARRAAETARRAIALAQSSSDRARFARLDLLLGRAELRGGRRAEAEDAVRRGLEAFNSERERLAKAGGTSRADDSWGLFELGMILALDRSDTARAFSLAAAARSRDGASVAGSPDVLGQVQERLEDGEGVIALNQLDRELLVWLVTKKGVDVVRRPLGRRESVQLVSRHRDEIELEVLRPRAGAALFTELIQPLSAQLKPVEHLIVLPDAPYYSVAFAALWDRTRDRFVIEDKSLSVLSDVGTLINAKTTAAATAPRSAFVDVALPSTADAAFAVWSSAPERAIVRVAAPVRANNEFPGLSSVMFADAPGRRYSGLVLTREIATRDLSRLGVVILSDCRLASDPGEGQGTLSAAAAFLAAGVPSVVATLWPIDESDRSDLFAGLDRELRLNNSAAAAIRSLQRDVLRHNGRRLGAWTGLVAYGVGR
jgi:CHAT domain-containing protein